MMKKPKSDSPVGVSRKLSDGLESRKRLGVGRGIVDGGRGRGDVEDAGLSVLTGYEEVLALTGVGDIEWEVTEVSVVEARRGLERVEDGHVLKERYQRSEFLGGLAQDLRYRKPSDWIRR